MKKKIIGIFVCTLLIITALPVVGTINLNQVNEKTFIVIYVYIRHSRPGEIWVDDAKVTATHSDGEVFNVEYCEDGVFDGYWLHGPIGNYNIEAKRGLRRGSTQGHIYETGLSFAWIDLKFFEVANVYHEQPFLSILRLILSRLPIFK